jgi:hypothetical protein
VLGIDAERRRLSLSLSSSRENAASTEEMVEQNNRAPDKFVTFGDLLSKIQKK